jgi:H+/Cl- antiporter ClcA
VNEQRAGLAGGRTYLRLVFLGALIGIPAALLAAGFLALVHEVEILLWEDLPDALGHDSAPLYLVVALPAAGAALVAAARALLPGDGGHSPLEGIKLAPTPPLAAVGVAMAALGTLSFGAVLGPEAPLIALGAAVGVAAVPLLRAGPREAAALGTAGSFSAISALFGGPIVAGILLVEASAAQLGAALIPTLLPGLVAAACGYVVFVGLGDWGGLDTVPLAVPGLPEYDGTRVADLVTGAGVGVLTALAIVAVMRLAHRVQGQRERGWGMPALLVAGGLATGLLAAVADLLGASSQDVLFSGQAAVPDLVGEDSAGIVLVLLAAKALAYAICLGCGFRGGPVFPAIFLGISLATLAVIAFDMSPTAAVAIGAAAGTAAATRLLFASLFLSALLVGIAGLDAVPAAVFAAVAAWLTRAAFDPPPPPATPAPR